MLAPHLILISFHRVPPENSACDYTEAAFLTAFLFDALLVHILNFLRIKQRQHEPDHLRPLSDEIVLQDILRDTLIDGLNDGRFRSAVLFCVISVNSAERSIVL
jgi:hypothetical protein